MAVIAIGFLGFALMCVAFILSTLRGGWYRAMPPSFQGEEAFPLQRQLMFAGVLLSTLFVLLWTVLMFLPGGIPRFEDDDPPGISESRNRR
ncbi:MAG: hypothetical protein KY468_19135 [Armatimonadetes bacterium]|nr:hypothetical protein [Armatimonadota bacterium]